MFVNFTLYSCVLLGFRYYDDILKGMSKAEAEALAGIIEEAVHMIVPDGTVTLTGGFRR